MTDPITPIAKALHRRLTDTERRLWTPLRAHRLARWKFKRQQTIGPYIVDFVCFRARLVIEVAEKLLLRLSPQGRLRAPHFCPPWMEQCRERAGARSGRHPWRSDGGQHQGSAADRAPEAWLEGQGFRVLRFWNNEVSTGMPAVLEKIAEALSPSPPPLSHEGRGELLPSQISTEPK